MGLTFLAFDVETANASRASVCAVGVAKVDDGVLTSSRSWLVSPHPDHAEFSYHNTRVHGLRAHDVVGAPAFTEVLAEVLALADGAPFVAHNAPFDRSALVAAAASWGVEAPAVRFHCTYAMSRSAMALPDHRLPTVAGALGVTVHQHHEAESDALACAGIALALAARLEAADLDDLAHRCGTAPHRPGAVRPGATRPGRGTAGHGTAGHGTDGGAPAGVRRAATLFDLDQHVSVSSAPLGAPVRRRSAPPSPTAPARATPDRPARAASTADPWSRKAPARDLAPAADADPTHPLHGQTVVFTGDLAGMSRAEAQTAASGRGAHVRNGVTKKTSMLVLGDGLRVDQADQAGTGKVRRALDLMAGGQRIVLVDEATFTRYVTQG